MQCCRYKIVAVCRFYGTAFLRRGGSSRFCRFFLEMSPPKCDYIYIHMKDSPKMPVVQKRRIDKFCVFVYFLVAAMFSAQVAIIVWGYLG